jgi:Fuc2NAc and GlcNAc transferase
LHAHVIGTPTTVVLVAALSGAALASAALTGWLRQLALARRWLDVPNERSSHSTPTPRGGGLAFAITVLAGVLVGGAAGTLSARTVIGIGGGGALVAVIGWIDDHRQLSQQLRAVGQIAAAAWALAWLGGMPSLSLGAERIALGGAGVPIALLVIVWAINLYNFMDGIDGLAASEAVSVGIAGGVLAWLAGDPALGVLSLLVAASGAGFLYWNWPPARIFMGDVGSGFLGFMFGALAVLGERRATVPLLLWLLLGGVFVGDATVTLIRRLVRGDRWYAAHRTHAYQRAVAAGRTHRQVTLRVLLLNLVLAALAGVAAWRPQLSGGTLVAALVLVGSWYRLASREPRRAASPAAAGPTPERDA